MREQITLLARQNDLLEQLNTLLKPIADALAQGASPTEPEVVHPTVEPELPLQSDVDAPAYEEPETPVIEEAPTPAVDGEG